MKTLKNKTMAITISMLFILSMTASLMLTPHANAAIPATQTSYPTNCYSDIGPNPCGVGQSFYVNGWLLEMDPLTSVNNGMVWKGFTVIVTTPSGTSTTLGPFTASAAATIGVSYTPATAGNYTVEVCFPGQAVTSSSLAINTYYEPSNVTTIVVVQTEPISGLPQNPLPTSYWTNPVYWTNQEWQSISGNWLGDITLWNETSQYGGQGYAADTNAPETSHIMWTEPDGTFGGQVGGYQPPDLSNYYDGKSYEQFFWPPVIINGIMYYNYPSGTPPYYGVYAVNLRTGQQEFYMNVTGVAYGEIYTHHNPNEVGAIAYLWGQSGSTMSLYNAANGELIVDITGAASGATTTLGPNGEILQYSLKDINSTYATLTMWNSTQCLWYNSENVNAWEYRPLTGAVYQNGAYTLPYSDGIQFSVVVPIYGYQTGAVPSILYVDDGAVLTTSAPSYTLSQAEAAYSASTGALLWDTNRTIGLTTPQASGTASGWMMGAVDGLYIEHNKQTDTYYAFSMTNGTLMWGPTVSDTNPWDSDARDMVSDGSAIFIQGAGSVCAYSITNGDFLWQWTPPNAGVQTPTETYLMEMMYGSCCGGGEIFVGTGLSHGDQFYNGAQIYALNTTTGQVVWSINGWIAEAHTGDNAIADGYFVTMNGYDNQIYCFGQGPSKTTISAPQMGITTATPITMTGSVTDISAGSQENEVAANFPNGLPCVSDASMSSFMEAVYEQQPMPSNVTGVPVTFYVLDSNGNYRAIGTTTTDALGDYSFTWTPDITGNYTVYAIFAGTGAYYGSSASTGFYASSPGATPAPTASPMSGLASTSTVMYMGIALIIVVVIVGAAILLAVTRKRP